MPADDRLRLDDQESRTPTGPKLRQPNPQKTIGAMEHEALGLLVSFQHGQLVAQGKDLRLHRRLAAKSGEKRMEHH